jgi:polysaccharide deacetylase family protein (PEP-CTERM system associated)
LDIEEWFHLLDIDYLEKNVHWQNLESRIYENTQKILEILQQSKVKATFFILGWIAEKYPDLVRLISDFGYDIGTHSHNHILIFRSTPKLFREDLKKSIDIIQNLTQRKVRCFRAPGFSIKKESLWAFEILITEGIDIDSSIFPASRGHGGIKNFGLVQPFRINVGGSIIKEFPINIFKIGGFKIPFSGGGYFRFYPYQLISFFIKNSSYVMTYFHPRDFDVRQPALGDLPVIRKIKSYIGIAGALKKFNKILDNFHFIDISRANEMINWDNVPIINI